MRPGAAAESSRHRTWGPSSPRWRPRGPNFPRRFPAPGPAGPSGPTPSCGCTAGPGRAGWAGPGWLDLLMYVNRPSIERQLNVKVVRKLRCSYYTGSYEPNKTKKTKKARRKHKQKQQKPEMTLCGVGWGAARQALQHCCFTTCFLFLGSNLKYSRFFISSIQTHKGITIYQ